MNEAATALNLPKRSQQEIQILALVRESEGMSRVQLAQQMGLHLPAITLLTSSLIKEGLIREEGLASSTGGRPSILLRLNPQAAYFLGVEVGLNFVRTLLTDLSGTVLQEVAEAVEKPLELKALLSLIKSQAAAVSRKAPSSRLKGMGVAVAGMVDRGRGLVLNANILGGSEPVALEAKLKAIFPDLPLVLHNDANAAALGEHWYGGARKVQNFFWVYLGLGTGLGIFSKGEIYLGAHGIAGELGFSCVGDNGEYLTKWASGEALVSMLAAKLKAEGYARQMALISQALAKGDAPVAEAVAKVGRRLGMALAGMVNLFDPAEVFLGGPLLSLGTPLLEAMRQSFGDRLLLPQQYALQQSRLGEEAVARGAAATVIREFLSSLRPSGRKPRKARKR